jgi:hypothetical protein
MTGDAAENPIYSALAFRSSTAGHTQLDQIKRKNE